LALGSAATYLVMTTPLDPTPQTKPPIATGWLLWLTWFFALVLGVGGVIASALFIIIGPEAIAAVLRLPLRMPDHLTVWWAIEQVAYLLFGIACVGVLLRDRDWARTAVVVAWVIVLLQCVDAGLQIFHWRLSIPIGALLYVAFAVKTATVLRGLSPAAAGVPPGSRGTL